jgi:hypothetical protein
MTARIPTTHDTRSATAGSALVPVLVLLSGVLVMGFAFSHTVLTSQKGTQRSLDDRRALYLAEAGLNEAYEAVREGHTGAIGTVDQPAILDGGLVWVVAEDIGNDQRRLTSTALVGSGRQALESVIAYGGDGEPPLFVSTLNSKEALTLSQGVLIDSFDSDLGDYASQATNTQGTLTYAGAEGDVRSNADVILNANASVFGDAISGPTGSVSLSTGSYVDGTIASASEPFVFPPIAIPTFTPLGDYALAQAGTGNLGPGDFAYGNFDIGKDATLTVTGPADIVVDDFIGGKTANLVIDASAGPVTFHVRNTYTHTAGFEATAATGSPMLLAFFIDGTQNVTFPNQTDIRGAYYAPNADIVFANGNECWGAFAANRISMSNDMAFHYDVSLLRHWYGETGSGLEGLTVLAWHRTAVLPVSLLADRRPPLEVLGLDAGDLAVPGEAWQ